MWWCLGVAVSLSGILSVWSLLLWYSCDLVRAAVDLPPGGSLRLRVSRLSSTPAPIEDSCLHLAVAGSRPSGTPANLRLLLLHSATAQSRLLVILCEFEIPSLHLATAQSRLLAYLLRRYIHDRPERLPIWDCLCPGPPLPGYVSLVSLLWSPWQIIWPLFPI